MIRRFWTLSDAAIFASRMRSEGYFAEIVDLHTAHLWCPDATQGFSVIVSSERFEDGELEEPDEKEQPQGVSFGCLPQVISLFLITLGAFMGLLAIVGALNEGINELKTSQDARDDLFLALVIIFVGLVIAFPIVAGSTRLPSILHDETHHLHKPVRVFYTCVAIMLITKELPAPLLLILLSRIFSIDFGF